MGKDDQINLDKDDLEVFFIKHLDKIYAAKSLLVSELPQILDNAYFTDLRDAICETVEDVKKQILRMDEVYQIMGASVSSSSSGGLKGLINDSFSDIGQHGSNPELRDMSILFYLHNIESVEMASFQILEMLAVKLKNERIKELIKINYEEAKTDRTLFLLINAKYISTV
jgi:ferritin-like metal-binding protein YciE